MITGHKPSAYFETADGEGHKHSGECRQCIHCLYTWEYRPGSGITRGYCVKCGGFLCARDECAREQIRLTGNTTDCLSFYEWHSRREDKIRKLLPLDPELTVTDSGLIVPRKRERPVSILVP